MNLPMRIIALAGLGAGLMAASPPPSLSISPAASGLPTQTSGDPTVRSIVASVGADYTSAPIPDSDQAIPFVKNPRTGQAQVGPGLFAPPGSGYRGEGYVPGSSVDGEQQRKVKPGGGISLKVPLN